MNPSEIARQIVAQWIHRTGASVAERDLRALREAISDDVYEIYQAAFRLGKHEGEISACSVAQFVSGVEGQTKEKVE